MKQRIQIADVLRGFTLLAIIVLHFTEHFDLLIYPQSNSTFISSLDNIISRMVFLLFKGKAYAIFSLLFGFSFYIQVKNWEEKGYNFKFRFIWRLCILFIIGYFHSLIYIGDVLTVFAVLGLPLILIYNVSNKNLLYLSLIFFLQIPSLFYFLLTTLFNIKIPIDISENTALSSQVFANESFYDIMKFNATEGFLEKWHFIISTGRYSQMFGLFIIGLLIGRTNFFNELNIYNRLLKKTFIYGILVSGIFFLLYSFVPNLSYDSIYSEITEIILKSYANLFFTITLLALFIIIYLNFKDHKIIDLFSYYGRMSLTNYLFQSFAGIFLLYGPFLGLYKYINPSVGVLIALIIFSFQVYFSNFWFRKFSYGPVEWLWRKLTFIYK
jgi:uncharacterized protein